LARGEPKPERTSEERERARAEREHRRAERSGLAVPPLPEPSADEPPVAPPESDIDEAPPPDPMLEEPAIAPPEPAAPPELPPEPVTAPGLVIDDDEQVPIESPEPMEPPPVIELSDEQDPPAEAPIAPPEPAAPPELPPEPVTAPGLVIDDDEQVPIEPPEPMEPPPVIELSDEQDPPAEAPSLQTVPREDLSGGYPIPGLPEEPPVEAPAPLPEPPPRLPRPEPTPMRRAFRRPAAAAGGGRGGGAGPDAVGLAGDGRSSPRRRMPSRWVALVALLAVGVVVALIVYSLTRSSHPAAVTAPPVVKILIPEGKTRLQIAQLASKAGLTGSYRRAARRSPLLNPASYGAPRDTPDLEGFLFPATYDMNKSAPAARLVEEQLTAFQENFGAEYAKRAKALGLTPYELLIVASMIEREAQLPSDRAKVAAVIYNRLRAGIPLGIDATIYYAVESAKNLPNYTRELTESQLHADSPYNTRTRKGLPPTPISNPGVASIQAAAHPSHASYLYYVTGADGCGEQKFATSEAKFQEDVSAYEAAKRQNGGHLPACKHR
jgi:cell division protein YceG involved in septum cleavage